MWKALAIAVTLVGCSSKPHSPHRDGVKPDCDAYASKIAAVMGATLDPDRRESLAKSAHQSCDAGRVTDDQATCVYGASTEDQIRACAGLGPASTAPPPPPAAKQTHVKVYSLGGATSLPADQRTWFEGVQSNVATACAIPEVVPPTHFPVEVHYEDGVPKTAALDHAPAPLRDCLTKAFMAPAARPASLAMDPLTFYVDVTN